MKTKMIGLGSVLAATLFTPQASAFVACNVVGGQAGVPFKTSDWASGNISYSYSKVLIGVNTWDPTFYWQIPTSTVGTVAYTVSPFATWGSNGVPANSTCAEFDVTDTFGNFYATSGSQCFATGVMHAFNTVPVQPSYTQQWTFTFYPYAQAGYDGYVTATKVCW